MPTQEQVNSKAQTVGLAAAEHIVSVVTDVPLRHEQVTAHWRDEFLTNVIVPHLEHIVGMYEVMVEHARSKSPVDENAEAHYQAKIHAMLETIHALHEWRG